EIELAVPIPKRATQLVAEARTIRSDRNARMDGGDVDLRRPIRAAAGVQRLVAVALQRRVGFLAVAIQQLEVAIGLEVLDVLPLDGDRSLAVLRLEGDVGAGHSGDLTVQHRALRGHLICRSRSSAQ